MNEDKNKIYEDDLELEDILRPRCEFRVSTGFKDRVMAESLSIRKRQRRRRIPYLALSGAAAAVAIVVMITLDFHKMDPNVETPQISAAFENQTSSPSDSLEMNPRTQLLADVSQTNSKKETVSKTIPKKKNRTLQTESSKPPIMEEEVIETDTQAVTEGEMPMTNKETSLDPDEVRTRLIETRRNAEIAFIERIRDEIEANQAYVAQLMSEENVYQ